MRLEKSINNEAEKLAKILKSDCDKFLNEVKGGTITGKRNGSWFLRGIDTSIKVENGLIRKKSYLNALGGRIPRLASQFIHNLVNNVGSNIFGWPIRDGVATRGIGYMDVGDKTVFGKMRIFLPIGDYDYVWSPGIKDFNNVDVSRLFDENNLTKEMYGAILLINKFYSKKNSKDAMIALKDSDFSSLKYSNVYDTALKSITKFIKKNYKNDDIQGAIESENETSFNCDEYYLVSDNLIFKKALKLGGWRK